jgi:hypothetical protein
MGSHFVDEIMFIATRNMQVPKSLAREFFDFPVITLDFVPDGYFHGLPAPTLIEFSCIGIVVGQPHSSGHKPLPAIAMPGRRSKQLTISHNQTAFFDQTHSSSKQSLTADFFPCL